MKYTTQMTSVIKQLLATLKSQGYDRIVTSGGTSLDGAHYGGVIGYDFDPMTKEMYFVGVPYNSQYHKGNDQSNHTKRPDETPVDTAVREFFEETGLKAKPQDLIHVYEYSVKDNRPEKIGQKHRKVWFMLDISKCSGELYTFEGPNPIDGETAAPIMMPAPLFAKELFVNHKPALKCVVDKLSQNRDYAFSLMNLLN